MVEEVKTQLEACGIDVAGAMERMMGNEMLFLKMMRKFPEDEVFRNLKEKLAEKDYGEAFQYAHALKGVAGNLGLNPIMEADIVIVEKLRHYTEESVKGIDEDFKQLEAVYDQICAKLKEL